MTKKREKGRIILGDKMKAKDKRRKYINVAIFLASITIILMGIVFYDHYLKTSEVLAKSEQEIEEIKISNASPINIDEIIANNGITDLVLGLPKNMNNTLGFAAERSMKFKVALEERYSIEVKMIDERLSTVEATNYLLDADMSRKKRKKVVDGVAASIILDTYLKMKGN